MPPKENKGKFIPNAKLREQVTNCKDNFISKLDNYDSNIKKIEDLFAEKYKISKDTIERYKELKNSPRFVIYNQEQLKFYFSQAKKAKLNHGISDKEQKDLLNLFNKNKKGKQENFFQDQRNLYENVQEKRLYNILNFQDIFVGNYKEKIDKAKVNLENLQTCETNLDTVSNNVNLAYQNYFEDLKNYNNSDETQLVITEPKLDQSESDYDDAIISYRNVANDSLKVMKLNSKHIEGIESYFDGNQLPNDIDKKVDNYLENHSKIEGFVKQCDREIGPFESNLKYTSIPEEKQRAMKHNADYISEKREELETDYFITKEMPADKLTENNFTSMMNYLLLNPYLLKRENSDLQKEVKDYCTGLKRIRNDIIGFPNELRFQQIREHTKEDYNEASTFLPNKVDLSNDFFDQMDDDYANLTGALSKYKVDFKKPPKFQNDNSTKTLANYIGLTQSINKYFNKLKNPTDVTIPATKLELYKTRYKAFEARKNAMNELMNKSFEGDKTIFNQIMAQITNPKTCNEPVDINKIDRCYDRLNPPAKESKAAKTRVDNIEYMQDVHRNEIVDVVNNINSFSKNENDKLKERYDYVRTLRNKTEALGKGYDTQKAVRFYETKSLDEKANKFDDFVALADSYSKKNWFGKFLNLGTYSKLNNMQKELKEKYNVNETVLKIAREGSKITQDRLNEIVKSAEPTKENMMAILDYGSKANFESANFQTASQDFLNRFTDKHERDLETSRKGTSIVLKEAVDEQHSSNKNLLNEEAKKSNVKEINPIQQNANK